MKHGGKQPLLLFKLVLWCKSIQEWGEYMSNFFNKRPWLLKRVIFVIVSSILLTALEQFCLAACKLHGALVFQSGSKHEYRGEFHRKKNRPSNSTQLVADNFCRPLGKGLRQCRRYPPCPCSAPCKNALLKDTAFPLHLPQTSPSVQMRSDSSNSVSDPFSLGYAMKLLCAVFPVHT